MVKQDLRNKISNKGYASSIVYDSPSFDDSIIGIDVNGKTVYAFPLMVDEFVKDEEGDNYDNLSEEELCTKQEEAVEFIDYNTIRATPYMSTYGITPVIVDYDAAEDSFYDLVSGQVYSLDNIVEKIDEKYNEFLEYGNVNMEIKKRILVVIDVQNDFISGSLANEEAQRVLPNIIEKVKGFNGDAIFLTRDTHLENYSHTSEAKKLPIPHCIYKTDGWMLPSGLANVLADKMETGKTLIKTIFKPTFGSVEPMTSLKNFDSLPEAILSLEEGEETPIPMEIEICGFDTDVCVVSNALILKAFTHDFAEITVDSQCCAGTTPEKHEAALEVMKSCQINIK